MQRTHIHKYRFRFYGFVFVQNSWQSGCRIQLRVKCMIQFSLMTEAAFIADNLYQTCVVPDGGQRLRETGAISPATSLKNVWPRYAFEWASMFHTKQIFLPWLLFRLGVQQLLRYQNVDVPVLATTPKNTWVEQQAKLVMQLCARSRKNCGSAPLRTLSYRQAGLMDWDQTMPLQAGFAAPSWSCSKQF